MKKVQFVIFISYCFLACSNYNSNITIISNKDSVAIGETFIAKINVPFYDSIAPLVYITLENDTTLIPYYEDRNYALFQAEGSSAGLRKYFGFAEYIDNKGDIRKENFLIEFYVYEESSADVGLHPASNKE